MIPTKKIEEKSLVTGVITIIGTDSKTGKEICRSVSKNLVMQGTLTGLDFIIQWIIGNMAAAGSAAAFVNGINYGEIGTGNTTPTLADTSSTTPVARMIPSFQQDYGQSQAIVQFFFPDSSLINQTYYEFSTWINGSSGLGTGNIFNHGLFGAPYAKVSGQDTTVQVAFTVGQ